MARSVTVPGNPGTGSGPSGGGVAPALPNSEAQVGVRRGHAEGREPGWRVPGPRRRQPRPGRSADSGLAAPASPRPPAPQPLPLRRGSPPCRRPGSRRSARSPWRRAIRTARPAQRCSASRTARSTTPRSTWDVALAAARAGPHSPPGDRRPAATAAATPQTAPPAGSRRERHTCGLEGGGGGGTWLGARESGSTAPNATPGYGAPERTRLI